MSSLEKVGLEFAEQMSGAITVGATDPREGARAATRTQLAIDVRIRIDNLARFLRVAEHEGSLQGTVACESLGGDFEMREGTFNLFRVDPATGIRQMVYHCKFTADDGQTYTLHGHKDIHDDPGQIDVVDDMTSLFTTVHLGEDEQAPVYGAGILYFKLSDALALVRSARVLGDVSVLERGAALLAFVSFGFGGLRNEYLQELLLTYDTGCQNLVLSGTVRNERGEARRFFLVSGVHEVGFPWGDGETFSDVHT